MDTRITVVGIGRCGNRIADEFFRANVRARVERGFGITAGVFAVDSDQADLTALKRIRPERCFLIGDESMAGQGTARQSAIGGELVKKNADRIVEAVGKASKFMETDAILLIAGSAGGTGSAGIPILTQRLKERYAEKRIYNLVVTPTDEEQNDAASLKNTALCLKSAYSVADAVFLLDNQRFINKNLSVTDNAFEINTAIVDIFYELLCAGEEKTPSHIGAKTVDAGDIIQTLVGWTVIGLGKVSVHSFRVPLIDKLRESHFIEKFSDTNKGIQALEEAMSEISFKCNPATANRALYLLAGPAEEMGLNLFSLIGNTLRQSVPDAIMRSGDYPRRRNSMSVTLILSELDKIEKVTEFFNKAAVG